MFVVFRSTNIYYSEKSYPLLSFKLKNCFWDLIFRSYFPYGVAFFLILTVYHKINNDKFLQIFQLEDSLNMTLGLYKNSITQFSAYLSWISKIVKINIFLVSNFLVEIPKYLVIFIYLMINTKLLII
jgi:hypothetical protein